jgi:hypothetical protein
MLRDDLIGVFQRLGHPHILVVGDLLLERSLSDDLRPVRTKPRPQISRTPLGPLD